MTRTKALNYILGGALGGVLLSQACSAGSSTAQLGPLQAWAQGNEPVLVEIVGSPVNPVPVRLCDGQELSGTCATVYESAGGDHVLRAN